MKTPEEIKKGLECGLGGLVSCRVCGYKNTPECNAQADADALDYIQHLERERYENPVRHGRWNEPTGRFQDGFWVCSSCNFCSEATAAPILYKFCPNCGAKMDAEE